MRLIIGPVPIYGTSADGKKDNDRKMAATFWFFESEIKTRSIDAFVSCTGCLLYLMEDIGLAIVILRYEASTRPTHQNFIHTILVVLVTFGEELTRKQINHQMAQWITSWR